MRMKHKRGCNGSYSRWVSGGPDTITGACACGDTFTFPTHAKDRISVAQEYTFVASGSRVRVTSIDYEQGNELVRYCAGNHYASADLSEFRRRVGMHAAVVMYAAKKSAETDET